MRSVARLFGLGYELIFVKMNESAGDQKEDKKSVRVCRRPFCRAVIGDLKGQTSKVQLGIFTNGCF